MKMDEACFWTLMKRAGRGGYVYTNEQLLVGWGVAHSEVESIPIWSVISIAGGPLSKIRLRLPGLRDGLLAGLVSPQFHFDVLDDYWQLNIAFNDGAAAVIVETVDEYDYAALGGIFHFETRPKDTIPLKHFQEALPLPDWPHNKPWTLDLRLCGVVL
jgi:hypothetical protein